MGPNDGFVVGKLDGRCVGEADVGFPVGLPTATGTGVGEVDVGPPVGFPVGLSDGLREGFGVG